MYTLTRILIILTLIISAFLWIPAVSGNTPYAEDDPTWQCAIMGNMVCGEPYRNPVPWPIRR